ncbi:CPBP family intramembrane glutamic endopeptidase [Natronobacterium texcoconense]|uniref:CAAX prenyl protease 2/Lysostaphin resistance protein A-like domain-containing protein n=1 Tax=Natronobacterium texcoconense TaxID=1095778 RepID=A0A1H1F245_NATTX|nr:type II CAAX endopeptidase family protein [Natronobacterium texcoconense]SDQ95043.1 hypothetical protein SAMN04489842_1790 [Natronobacterium texcoconense]
MPRERDSWLSLETLDRTTVANHLLEDSGRFRAGVRAVLPAAITVPGILLALAVLSPVTDRLAGDGAVGVGASLVANWLAYLLPIAIALWIAVRLDRGSLARFGLDVDRQWAGNFGAGAVISLSAIAISIGYGAARGYYTVSPELLPELLAPGIVFGVVVGLAAFFLLQNVYEELVFRGVMLQNFAEGLFARGMSPVWAVGGATGASLLLFGLFHLPLRGGFVAAYSVLVGIPFALAYLVTGRLGLAIGVHFGRFPIELLMGGAFGPVELPTVVEMTGSGAGMLETTAVQLGGTCLLVLLWALLVDGEIGLAERVYLPSSDRA